MEEVGASIPPSATVSKEEPPVVTHGVVGVEEERVFAPILVSENMIYEPTAEPLPLVLGVVASDQDMEPLIRVSGVDISKETELLCQFQSLFPLRWIYHSMIVLNCLRLSLKCLLRRRARPLSSRGHCSKKVLLLKSMRLFPPLALMCLSLRSHRSRRVWFPKLKRLFLAPILKLQLLLSG